MQALTRMRAAIGTRLSREEHALQMLLSRPVLAGPGAVLDSHRVQLEHSTTHMRHAIERRLAVETQTLTQARASLAAKALWIAAMPCSNSLTAVLSATLFRSRRAPSSRASSPGVGCSPRLLVHVRPVDRAQELRGVRALSAEVPLLERLLVERLRVGDLLVWGLLVGGLLVGGPLPQNPLLGRLLEGLVLAGAGLLLVGSLLVGRLVAARLLTERLLTRLPLGEPSHSVHPRMRRLFFPGFSPLLSFRK